MAEPSFSRSGVLPLPANTLRLISDDVRTLLISSGIITTNSSGEIVLHLDKSIAQASHEHDPAHLAAAPARPPHSIDRATSSENIPSASEEIHELGGRHLRPPPSSTPDRPRPPCLPVPLAALRPTLRRYQQEAVEWMRARESPADAAAPPTGACLWRPANLGDSSCSQQLNSMTVRCGGRTPIRQQPRSRSGGIAATARSPSTTAQSHQRRKRARCAAASRRRDGLRQIGRAARATPRPSTTTSAAAAVAAAAARPLLPRRPRPFTRDEWRRHLLRQVPRGLTARS